MLKSFTLVEKCLFKFEAQPLWDCGTLWVVDLTDIVRGFRVRVHCEVWWSTDLQIVQNRLLHPRKSWLCNLVKEDTEQLLKAEEC